MYTWIVTVSPLYLDSFFTISWARGRRHSVQHYKIITSSRIVWTEHNQQNKEHTEWNILTLLCTHSYKCNHTSKMTSAFLPRVYYLNAIHFDKSKSPYVPVRFRQQNELLTSHYVIGAVWFKYLCSVFCFDMSVILGKICIKADDVGLLDKLINKQELCTYTVLPAYDVHTRACISCAGSERCSFHSIKYQVNTRPKICSSHLFAGKNTYCSFSVCIKQRPFGIETERIRSLDPRVLIEHSVPTGPMYHCA